MTSTKRAMESQLPHYDDEQMKQINLIEKPYIIHAIVRN